jgi:excisionase family DNA binding protein
MSDVESWITVAEAAARTGQCAATIRSQFDAGVLTGVRGERGHRLIDPASLGAAERHGLSVTQACALLDRSGDTVRRWFDEGVLTGTRDRNGHRRIDPASVRSLLRKRFRSHGKR